MMPRRPAEGHTLWRDQFVEQMRALQEERGMSDQGLAERISKHYPMSPSAVWKLKNASPKRGLQLDEAQAIVNALGFNSIDQFLNTWTTASRVQYCVMSARERVIVYGQEIPRVDVLTDLREAWEAVDFTTATGHRLKDAEVANLEAGANSMERATAELVDVVATAARQIRAHVEYLRSRIEANKGSEGGEQ